MNPRPRVRRDRTFTGCWRCRARKVKCDEKRPECGTCIKMGHACDGYGPKLVWVDNESHTYKSEGRRHMSCELTWKDLPVLDSGLVDYLITQCDIAEGTLVKEQASWTLPMHNPFRTFKIKQASRNAPPLLSRAGKLLRNGGTNLDALGTEQQRVFHHYVNHVAFLMMPFNHPKNPWRMYYPSASLQYGNSEQKALYNAILAHSAFNLASLGGDADNMNMFATKHYTRALEELARNLEDPNRHYAGTVATILSLMMAEIYSGRPALWRHHLKGAWSILRNYESSEPWNESEFAFLCTQSLHILRIIGETKMIVSDTDTSSGNDEKNLRVSEVDGDFTAAQNAADAEPALVPAIMSHPRFGYTIGAKNVLLECISKITAAGRQPVSEIAIRETASEVFSCLDSCYQSTQEMANDPSNDMARHQTNAFIFAIYIYIYRVLFNEPPCKLVEYVSLTLEHVAAFHACCTGNFSIWPAFIAAVEAYTDETVVLARAWLDRTTTFGLGNRITVRTLVEEVWRRRDTISTQTYIERGSVAVDWRQVMSDLKADILLI